MEPVFQVMPGFTRGLRRFPCGHRALSMDRSAQQTPHKVDVPLPLSSATHQCVSPASSLPNYPQILARAWPMRSIS